MAVHSAKSGPYRFGPFEFDPQIGELRKQGLRIRLEGQPVAILATLLERRGELVTREELQKQLWPGDIFVDFERSLNAAIRRLRLALDDSAESPRYIETLARKGYRWVAPLNSFPATSELEAAVAPPEPKAGLHRKLTAMGVVVAVAIISAVIFWGPRWWRSPSNASKIMLAVLPFQNLSSNAQQEFFADGMTEEMITQLGGLDPYRVDIDTRTNSDGNQRDFPEGRRC